MSLFRLYSNPLVRWWWGMDRPTFMMLVALMVLGGVIVTTAAISVADVYSVDVYYFARRQAIFLSMAILGMIMCSFFEVRTIKGIGLITFLIFAACVPLTLIMGTDVKGATRWIEIAGFSLQPTEFLKPSMAVMTATLLSSKVPENQLKGFWVSMGVLGLIGGTILLQPDFGMFLMLSMLWFVQAFASGVSLMILAPLVLVGLTVIAGAYFSLDHVRSRIHRFLDPSSGDSYQVDQARDAIMSGGFWGRGAGEGIVKHDLPDAHTDFIFAVVGEEFGIIACIALLILYAAIVFRCYSQFIRESDRFVAIAGIGLVTIFALQALVNMGVVLSVLPTTGMTLPFISYGGTATLAMGMTMGFVLSLTRKRSGYKRKR